MDIKRFLSAAAAVMMSAVCLSANTYAVIPYGEDEYYEILDSSAYEFKDYYSFEEWVHEGADSSTAAYGTDHIYLPSSCEITDIGNVYVEEDRITYRLYHGKRIPDNYIGSFTQYSGKDVYERLEKSELGESDSHVYKSTHITSYEDTDLTKGIWRLYWNENGSYFSVETNFSPDTYEALDFTRYRKVFFNRGFVRRNDKLTYLYKNGKSPARGLKTINGKKYCFDDGGYLICGKKKEINSIMYSFGENGEGKLFTGWYKTKNGNRYYKSGRYLTGTATINGHNYTFDSNGYVK